MNWIFYNGELEIVTKFLLGCPLSDVSLSNDLKLPVEDNVEWSPWLQGEKLFCAGAVTCW